MTAAAISTAPVGLPPYSGPGGRCPKCQVPCAASTQWHWAAVAFAPQQQPARVPVCGEAGLLGTPVDGEHLCCLCQNCGYGWAEACTAPGADAPRECLVTAPTVPLLALLGSLACTGAGTFLPLLLSGAALVAAWLAVATVTAVLVTVGYAAAGHASKEHRR